MPIESKLGEAILERIRSRKVDPLDSGAVDTSSRIVNAATSATVREATFEDFGAVSALNSRLGQGPDSVENWCRLWRDNPAITQGGATSRIGWVLEDAGAVVGFFGTIPLLYQFAQKPLIAAATCRFAVEPAYRAFSPLLLTSFFRQKDVDLFINSTATPSAGQMMRALKAVELPQPNYGTVLFWVLDCRAFARETLRKLGSNSMLSRMGSFPVSVVLEGEGFLRGRGPRNRKGSLSTKQMSIREMGPEFSQLWSEKNEQSRGLIATRSLEIMRWHFEPPHNRRTATVVGCYTHERLLGYAIVRHSEPATTGLRRSVIADMILRDESQQIVDALLHASFHCAKTSGSHALEVLGFPPRIRQMFLQSNPYTRNYPACPFFYKARNRELQSALSDANLWYATPFDGDSTVWP